MKKTFIAFLFFIFLICSVFFFGCSRHSPAPITGTEPGEGLVSGTITLPENSEEKDYYIVLFSDFNGFENSPVFVSGVCGPGTSIDYSINAPAGSYYMAVFVDNSGTGTPCPGDFVGVHGAVWPDWPSTPNVTITEDGFTSCDITLVQGSANITGQVYTFYEECEGKNYYIYLDTDADHLDNDHLCFQTGTAGQGDNYTEISFLAFIPGNYYLYAWVDRNEDGILNSGDRIGYYGVCPSCVGGYPQPPSSPNAVISNPASTHYFSVQLGLKQ
ncbi:MAG: hypothetical protein ACLFP1_06560 [Candidatus Goldiibacteriota bacterium]